MLNVRTDTYLQLLHADGSGILINSQDAGNPAQRNGVRSPVRTKSVVFKNGKQQHELRS